MLIEKPFVVIGDEDARTAAEGYRASFTATEARFRGGLASLFELEDARRLFVARDDPLDTYLVTHPEALVG